MKYLKKVVQIKGGIGYVPFEPDEWAMEDKTFGVMRHFSTGNTYRVHLRDEVGDKKHYDAEDFGALLIGTGSVTPKRKELIAEGRQAIAMFLQIIGYWKVNVPERPKRCRLFTHRKHRL
jgi:hypothetical protein